MPIRTLLFLMIFSLSACVYKQDIYQGNILDASQTAQLKLGMSKSQVIALLGSPQVTDPFHIQRWDYYASSKTNNQRDRKQSLITLLFEKDELAKIIN